MEILQQIMQDPQVLKEVSNMGSKLAGMTQAQQQISPRTKEMLGQAISKAQELTAAKRPQTPFIGDMAGFFTPEMASNVLRELGIPGARMGMRGAM